MLSLMGRLRERPVCVALLLLLQGAHGAPNGDHTSVLVVRSSRLPAYEQALEGLRSVVTNRGVSVTVLDLDVAPNGSRLGILLSEKPTVVVAFGSGSVEAVAAARQDSPLIAAMVLSGPTAGASGVQPLSTITVEVPPAAVLNRLKQLYPGRARIAIIRGPALSLPAAAKLEALARSQGFKVQVLDCPGPKELLETVSLIENRFDFAWCLPDSHLYQASTLSAFLLSAIRHRVPIIGFSEGIVRAGALVGFYADYRDIGRQTGEAVLRRIQSQPAVSVEPPRKLKAAVNERVMRVLGIQHATGADEVVK